MKNAKSNYPALSAEDVLGDKGRRIVENIIADQFGWILREVSKQDMGIDGFIEVLNENRKSQGRLFAVQIKCGSSYLNEKNDLGFVYRGKMEHLNYWLEYSLPVVLVICDPATNSCNWIQITPANVEVTGQTLKITVPFSQTLRKEDKVHLELVVNNSLFTDLIPLALFKLVMEKFPAIRIAQELETPHDFWGFDFLAELNGELNLITYIYKSIEEFSVSDIEEIIRKKDTCMRACGWDVFGPIPGVILFFLAHSKQKLNLNREIIDHLAKYPDIKWYRAECSFNFGISLCELDNNNEYISIYERKYI